MFYKDSTPNPRKAEPSPKESNSVLPESQQRILDEKKD